MLNQDKLNKLFSLATGRNGESVKEKVVSMKQIQSKKRGEKVKSRLPAYRGLFKDPIEAWTRWYEDSRKEMSSDNADDVWSHAASQHPQGEVAAKDYARRSASSHLSEKDPFMAETGLRNEMSQSPSWLRDEMAPNLASAANATQAQNNFKAKKVYEQSLMQKLGQMNLNELDQDVPAEVHVDELVKLELLGLTDMASIVNGRFAVADEKGAIRPVYDLDDPNDVASGIESDNPEMEMINSVVPKIAKSMISTAMRMGRTEQAKNNKAASGVAIGMLGRGMDVEDMGGAMSLMNDDSGGALRAGIRGRASIGPQTQDEMIMEAGDIADQYGGVE